MAETRSRVLWFGTFGDCTYDVESSSWTFSRNLKTERILLPLYDHQIRHPRQPSEDDEGYRHHKGARHRASQITALIKVLPDVQPAKPYLADLLSVSEAILNRSSHHDPLKGKQLDIGQVIDGSRRRSQLAAWISGATGSDVTIAKIVTQRLYWDDSPHAWMSVPTVGSGFTIAGPGAPIQQVCLARSVEGSQLVPILAIRMLTVSKLFLLKPVEDRFLAEPLMDIPIEVSGGHQHAHIAFNPWFARQVAIIDSSSSWRVWEATGRYYANFEQVFWHHGSSPSSHPRTFDDGWFRLVWIAGPTIVVSASRIELRIHNITKTAEDDHIIDVNLDADAGWIAEVSTLSTQPELLFVLSSSHLLVLRVSSKGKVVTHSIIWQVRHFANLEDFTLKMEVTEYEDDIFVILQSLTTFFSVFYQLHLSEDDEQTVSVLGPFQFVSPHDRSKQNALGLHLSSVDYHASSKYRPNSNAFETHRSLGLPTMQAFYVSNSHTLKTECYCLAPDHTATHALKPPDRTAANVDRIRKSDRSKEQLSQSEGSDIYSEHESTFEYDQPELPPQSEFVRVRTQQLLKQKNMLPLLDLTEVLSYLQHADDGDHNDIMEVLRSAQECCNNNDLLSGNVPEQLLAEGTATTTIERLEEASQLLSILLSASEDSQAATPQDDQLGATTTSLHRLPLSRTIAALVHNGEPSVLYDAIVSDWIGSLPASIPGETRLAKEILARQITADLTLASHALRVRQLPDPGETQVQEEQEQYYSQHSYAGLSSQQQGTLNGEDMFGPSRATSQAPESSATPSMVTSHSRASSIYEMPKFDLSKHILCTKPLPTSIARPWQRVLRHWDLGADPAEYDWRTRSKHVAQQAEEEELNSQLTEKERARLKRATERYMRRQRKEAAASQSQQLASSQAMDLMLSASQAIPDRTAKMESLSQNTNFASSQVVPGRQDGKPVKKKPRRKQGF